MSCPFISDNNNNDDINVEDVRRGSIQVEDFLSHHQPPPDDTSTASNNNNNGNVDLEQPTHHQATAPHHRHHHRMNFNEYKGLNRSMALGFELEKQQQRRKSHSNSNNNDNTQEHESHHHHNLNYQDYLRGQRIRAMSRRFSSTANISTQSLNVSDLEELVGHKHHHHHHHQSKIHQSGHSHHSHNQPSAIPEEVSSSAATSPTGNVNNVMDASKRSQQGNTNNLSTDDLDCSFVESFSRHETNPDNQMERMQVVREVMERQKTLRQLHQDGADNSTRRDHHHHHQGGGDDGDGDDDRDIDGSKRADYFNYSSGAGGGYNPYFNRHQYNHREAEMVPWYCVPVQRQRWGEDMILPHINWGDIFFDLFYVAAAYNLGVLLITFMNTQDWKRGIVYFIGIFGPLYGVWENDLYYSSRYTVVDHFHRIYDLLRFLLIAAIVLHIKSFQVLSDTSSPETFALMTSLLIESLMQLILNVELLYFAQGDRTAIYNMTKSKLLTQFIPTTVLYLAASIISGVMLFGSKNGDDDDPHRLLGGGAAGSSSSSGGGWGVADIPYLITMGTHILNLVGTLLGKLKLSRKIGHEEFDIRDRFVPHNIDYLIHRYGEWVMLMIGESVLSLLIVETVETADYYVIALVGVLTVILIQTLKFESEPSNPEGHALLQSFRSSTSFTFLIELLSMALISFGVSFKVMLTLAQKEGSLYNDDYGCVDGHRLLGGEEDVDCADDSHRRWLGEVPPISYTAASTLYCVSLAVVLICLELMLISHHGGINEFWGHMFKRRGDKWKLSKSMVFLNCAKIGLIAFIATMWSWETDPRKIASAGFLIVAALAFSRIVGWGVINKQEEIKHFMSVVENKTKSIVSAANTFTAKRFSNHMDLDGVVSSIWENSFDSIIVVDRMGTIKHVNTTTLTMFGYDDTDELVGYNVSMLVGGGQAEHHDHYLEQFNQSGRNSSTIGKQRLLYSRRKDNSEFSCVIGIKQVPDSDYLIGYIRNTTGIQNRNREEDLAIDPILRLVDDTSFDCIVVINGVGIIQHVNITTLSEFGYDFKDELVGQNVSVLVGGGHAAMHDSFIKRFHNKQKEKLDTVLGKRRKLKARRKDKSEFHCIISINTIPESGCLIGVIRNISGMSRKQKALEADDLSAEGSQNAEDFLDDSFDSIIISNEDGIIIRVNKTALESLGYDNKEELVGKNLSIIVGGGEDVNHDKYLLNFKKKKGSESVIGNKRILFARRKDGAEFPCIIGIKRMRNSTNLVGFIRDMSFVNEMENVSITNLPAVQSQEKALQPSDIDHQIDDTSFDCIVVFNKDGIIQNVNLTALSEFGYESKDGLVNKNVSALLGDDCDKYLMQFQQSGYSSAPALGKQRPGHARRQDGTTFACLIGLKMMTPDLVIAYIKNTTDLTQSKQQG